MIYTYNIQGERWQDYKSYIDCLIAYYLLEKSANLSLKNYIRHYRQFLMQIFSRDSILQLVPNAGISPFLEYSGGGDPDDRLSSLISALGMIFLNTPAGTDAPELRMLSGTLVKRAQLIYNDLVRNRDIIQTSSYSPLSSSQDWQENGSSYDRPSIRHRPYYEDRDNEKIIDAAESRQCKKYYSIYDKQNLTEDIMFTSHLPWISYDPMSRRME